MTRDILDLLLDIYGKITASDIKEQNKHMNKALEPS